MSKQFTAAGSNSACASASAQMPAVFSQLEATIPSSASSCDLSAAKARFNSVSSCSGFGDAFNGYCNALASCASGDSGSPSPSPSPSPAAPKTLELQLKIIETTIDESTIT